MWALIFLESVLDPSIKMISPGYNRHRISERNYINLQVCMRCRIDQCLILGFTIQKFGVRSVQYNLRQLYKFCTIKFKRQGSIKSDNFYAFSWNWVRYSWWKIAVYQEQIWRRPFWRPAEPVLFWREQVASPSISF